MPISYYQHGQRSSDHNVNCEEPPLALDSHPQPASEAASHPAPEAETVFLFERRSLARSPG